ncbi:MAG TPA: hypothetical protein EYP16_00890 [Candidatus Atribacteria bacterium]|nr:hypothetical protein [Candidatus Atribacteria bacterium]
MISKIVKLFRQIEVILVKYYLGIDLGTTNLKIVIIDETGCYIDSVGLGYQILSPHPGWAEQNPILWWEKTVEAINKLLKKNTHKWKRY